MRRILYARYDTRPKLLFTVLMVAALFLIPGLAPLALVTALSFAFSSSQVGIRKALRDLRAISGMLLVMLLFAPLNERGGEPLLTAWGFTVATREALLVFARVALRFVAVTIWCSLMMRTTPGREITPSLEWYGLAHSAALVLDLAMRFIPEFSRTFGLIRDSQRLRLPNPGEDEKGGALKALFPTLVAAMVVALRGVNSTAAAIDLRGYGRSNPRTRRIPLRKADAHLFTQFALAIIIPATLVAASRNLGIT